MKLKIKLKQRWITTVLKETDALAAPMPWHRGHKHLSSSLQRATPPRKPGLIRA